jgi:hypothetical protein
MIILLTGLAMAEPLSTSLKKGERCPYDGRLFNEEATASLIASNEVLKEKCEISLQYQRDTLNAEHELEVKYLQSELAFEKNKGKQLLAIRDTQIEKLQEHSNPYRALWWAAAGFTVGTLSVLPSQCR